MFGKNEIVVVNTENIIFSMGGKICSPDWIHTFQKLHDDLEVERIIYIVDEVVDRSIKDVETTLKDHGLLRENVDVLYHITEGETEYAAAEKKEKAFKNILKKFGHVDIVIEDVNNTNALKMWCEKKFNMIIVIEQGKIVNRIENGELEEKL